MSVLEYDPEIAIPIYLYQAADTDSTIHNKPCGIYAEIGESRLAYLNFPLAHLDIDSGYCLSDFKFQNSHLVYYQLLSIH